MTTATMMGAEFLHPVRTQQWAPEETLTWSCTTVEAPVTSYSQTPGQATWRGVASLSRDIDEQADGAQSLSW